MKANLLAVNLVLLASLPAYAQSTAPGSAGYEGAGYQITDAGQNFSRYTRVRYQTNALGDVSVLTSNSFVRIGNGLNRLQGERWIAATPSIIITNNLLIARGASHGSSFANDINSYSAIQTRLPSGDYVKSHLIGLMYADRGTNVLIGEIQSSLAHVRSNSVVYPDAFRGLKANVRYDYTAAGLSQNLTLNEKLPRPESLSLSSKSTYLVAITEFVQHPTPRILERTWRNGREIVHDASVDFGSMRLAPGRAFREDAGPREGVPVVRQFTNWDGRTLLLESVKYSDVAGKLHGLPPFGSTSTNATDRTVTNAGINRVSGTLAQSAGLRPATRAQSQDSIAHFRLPPPPPLAIATVMPPVQESAALRKQDGFTLDWDLIIGEAGTGDQAFPCGTFVMSGECRFASAVFTAGAVLKFEQYASLYIDGPAYFVDEGECGTAWPMVVLTSVHDTEYGEDTGSGSYYPFGPALAVLPDDLPAALEAAVAYHTSSGWGIVSHTPPAGQVTISATDADATRGPNPDNARFTISRDGDWSSALTVHFSVGGTAYTSDYQAIGTSVTIPANFESADVIIVPSTQSGTQHRSTVVLTIVADPGGQYIVGSPHSATVAIYDPNVSGPPPATTPSGLLAWWAGEGNGLDWVGGHNGTTYGTTTFPRGEVGQGFSFGASGSGVLVPDPAALHLQDFTVEAWLRRDSAMADRAGAGCANLIGWGWGGWVLGLQDDGQIYVGQYGISAVYAPNLRLDDIGNFHHLACTKSGGTVIFYLDGVAYQATAYAPEFTFWGYLGIGAGPGPGGDWGNPWNTFYGAIDEVSIYDHALTATEVQAIHNATWAGKSLAPVILTQPQGTTISAGGAAVLRVLAAGSPNLTYQWRLNGDDVLGATASALMLPVAQATDAGMYSVRVANGLGSVVSADALLLVHRNACVTPPPGLVGWWAGEADCQDWVGTAPGTIVGSVSFVAGKNGRAFSFDAPGSAVTLSSPTSLELQDFSIEAWIKRGSATMADWEGETCANLVGWGWGGWVLGLKDDGTLYLSQYGISAVYAPTLRFSDATAFHHIALTKSGDTVTFYIDGVPDVAEPYAPEFTFGVPFAFGAGAQSYDPAFQGVLDELSIYNRALTPAEVQSIYGAGWAGKFIDLDANGLPDSWERHYFGYVGVDPSGDLDGDFVSNLQEYLGQTDPNNIAFRTAFAADHVSGNVVNGTIELEKGAPAQMAVLVNNAIFSAATWAPYTANFSATLPAVDGRYTVWVGLRGLAEESQQTWDATTITRDTTPPLIVITNPVPTTTSIPMIHLRGYSLEPLSALRYDVSNDAGTITDLQGYVTHQTYDANFHDFSTNFFECLDIDLTNGLNTITLHATDLAGNVSVTQLALTLIAETTPPVLGLIWPQNAMQLSGDKFTVVGSVDDPTAAVTVSFLDAAGASQTARGIVERNGRFWIEGLPLLPGANAFTITATDVWTNSASINLAVGGDSLVLTIDPPDENLLFNSAITVSGTVSDPNRIVRVNGMLAAKSGNSWTASSVPVSEGGTARFSVAAYTADHDGDPGAAVCVEADVDKPARVYVSNDSAFYYWTDHDHWESHDGSDWADWLALHYNIHRWDDGAQESHGEDYYWTQICDPEGCGGGDCDDVITWPESYWPQLSEGSGTAVGGWCRGPGPNTYRAPVTIGNEHCLVTAKQHYEGEYAGGWKTFDYTIQRAAQTTVMLFTGGKPCSHRQSLFEITASAEEVLSDWAIPDRANSPSPWGGTPTRAIPPEQITLAALGAVGSDGKFLAALDDGTTRELTAKTPKKFYYFGIDGKKHPIIIECESPIPANRDRTTVGVGEKVTLKFGAPPPSTVPFWGHLGGGVTGGSETPPHAYQVYYTASSNATTDQVMANFFMPDGRKSTITIPFEVKAPTGYDATTTKPTTPLCLNPPYPFVGAGMSIRVVIAPTDVSFYRVIIYEVGEAASSLEGWYANNPAPSHSDWGANTPNPLGNDNSWSDNAYGTMPLLAPGWPGGIGGSFTWGVPVDWQVGNGPKHRITGWSQKFTLDADGTVTVTKFEHSAQRSPSQPCSTIH